MTTGRMRRDRLAWVAGCLAVAFIASLACGPEVAEPGVGPAAGIPDHPTARRMVDGVLPFALHDGIETSRIIAPYGLMAAVTMMPDKKLALVFPPRDRPGFDLAIGGLDHPWDRRPLVETPLEEVGHVTAVAGLDGAVWTVIRRRASPQALELVRWTEQGIEREAIARPAPSVGSPVNDRCPDVALGLSPDGHVDVVFAQNGAGGQTELHHARRTPSGQWEQKLVATANDPALAEEYSFGERSLGCQTLLDYDESGLPQVVATVIVHTTEGPQLASAGFLVGGDGLWYPSGTKYLKDGRVQWAGPGWHWYADYGVDLRRGYHGYLLDAGRVRFSNIRGTGQFGTWAYIGLTSLRVPPPPGSLLESQFHAQQRPLRLDSGLDFAENHGFGLGLMPDGGVCVARHPEQWAGVACWFHAGIRVRSNFNYRGLDYGDSDAPFWRNDALAMRSPIFARGPVNVHAAFCITRDGRLAACAGGNPVNLDSWIPIVQEAPHIVESSVDDGVHVRGSLLTVKLSAHPSELRGVTPALVPLTLAPGNDYVVHGVAHGDAYVITAEVQFRDEEPLQPHEVYLLQMAITRPDQTLVTPLPWQYTDNPGITRVFRVSKDGKLYHDLDPRSGELVMPCQETDEDGVCRSQQAVHVDSSRFARHLGPSTPFDTRTSQGATPRLYDAAGNEILDFAAEGAFDGDGWGERFELVAVLAERTSYELVFPEGIHDGLGNYLSDTERRLRFHTGLKDFRFLGSSPANGETGVSRRGPLYLFFNGSVDPRGADGYAVVLRSSAGEVPVSFARGGETEEGFAIVGQHSSLEPQTTYEIVILEDLMTEEETQSNGRLEGAPHVVTFTTGDE